MKQMPAAKFKAQCLALMDTVSASGEGILITKRGKPVAQLVPAKRTGKNILGSLRDKFHVKGKITDPAIPHDDWDQD